MPDWVTQIESFVRYHLSAGEGMAGVWPAIGAIVAGAILCLAGARLIRIGVVLGFAGAGAMLGAHVAARFELSVITGIVLGVLVVGLVGYALFRLWVALLTGLVAAVAAACIVMGPTLPGLWQEFEDTRIGGGAVGNGYALLTPEQQQAAQQAGVAQYFRDFAQHVWERYPGDARRAVVILAASFLVGAALGLFAHRWAIVLGTAVLGTMLILAGVVPLLNRHYPEVLQRCQDRPSEVLIALSVWALVAIVVQRRGLRPVAGPPPAPPQPAH